MFITGPEAVSEMTKNDALIIVDCNRDSYTEYPDRQQLALTMPSFHMLSYHHHQLVKWLLK